jgi:hypothetical protein
VESITTELWEREMARQLDLQRVTEQRDRLIATLEAIERAALDERARLDGEDIARMARAVLAKC